jgi:beta-galactosidase
MRLFYAIVLLLLTLGQADAQSPDHSRIILSWDNDWRFLKSDAKQAELPAFKDAAWRLLNVPHDWSIEGPFSEKNPAGAGGAFLPTGVGWYRKAFQLPVAWAPKRLFVEFDGVMANAEVWINGTNVFRHPNGRIGFQYELTGRVFFGPGKTNVLAVRVDNSRQPASRSYTGAGIYRHVRLVVVEPVHIVQWGTSVTTTKIAVDQVQTRVQTTVINQSAAPRSVSVAVDVFGPAGQIVQSAESRPVIIPVGRTVDVPVDFTILKPSLWDCDHPHLYTLAAKVRFNGYIIDSDVVTFGIREAKFEALSGFSLNGRPLKIKGVCLRQDAGALGVAAPDRAWERRLEQLKALGCNAIRASQEPFSPEFLDLCDRMGFLVVDEVFDCWTIGRATFGYQRYFKDWAKIDLRDTILRDRNHPSIILYSIGNEIRDTAKNEQAKKTLVMLRDVCHQFDPSRPVTQALVRPSASRDYKNGLADLLDVIGQNNRESELFKAFEARPTRKILSTESSQDPAAWLMVRDFPPCAGTFVWSGIDCLGEGRKWPWIGLGSGLLDRTGQPRPAAMERKSWWTTTPMVHIVRRVGGPRPAAVSDPDSLDAIQPKQDEFSDWSPNASRGQKVNVDVYSNCQEVELFLNGRSLGTRLRAQDLSPVTWQVPFEPGIIRAVGKYLGQPVAGHELRTAGPAASVLLSVDRNPLTTAWEDLSYVRATIVDKEGVPVPDARPVVQFKIQGPGAIIAVDSADNTSHEPFQASERRAYQGQCVAIIRAVTSEAPIKLSASAPGLVPASVTIDTVTYARKP